MNKVILGLILAVCVLGLALVMLNERLGRKPDSQVQQSITEAGKDLPGGQPQTDRGLQAGGEYRQTVVIEPEIMDKTGSETFEQKEAEAALAPPEEAPGVSVDAKGPEKILPPAETVHAGVVEEDNLPQDQPELKPKPLPKPVKPAPKPASRPQEPVKSVTPEKKGDKSISKFVVFAREKGATIRIGGNDALNYKHMILDNPDRVVVDLNGDWKFPDNPGIPKNDFVSNVRVGKLGDKTRVVIDLKEKPRIARVLPAKNGESVDIRLDK